MAAAAERDDRAAGEAEGVAVLVGQDDVVALDADGPVVADDDAAVSQARLPPVHYKAWPRSRHEWDRLRETGGRSHAREVVLNHLRRRNLALACALVLLLPAARAAAQWASLGAMPAPRRERAALI